MGRTVRFAARKGFSKRGLAWLAPFQARWADWAFVLGFVVADSDDYSTKFGFKLVVLEIGCSPKLVHSNDGVMFGRASGRNIIVVIFSKRQ